MTAAVAEKRNKKRKSKEPESFAEDFIQDVFYHCEQTKLQVRMRDRAMQYALFVEYDKAKAGDGNTRGPLAPDNFPDFLRMVLWDWLEDQGWNAFQMNADYHQALADKHQSLADQ